MGKIKPPGNIRPADWKELTAKAIQKNFHGGAGADDNGGIATIALRMLDRPEAEDLVFKLLVENGGVQFTRFDTDKKGGIDLASLLALCAIWSKNPRPPQYDLNKIVAEYHKTSNPAKRDLLFLETWLIAMDLALGKRRKRPSEALENAMIESATRRLRSRFGEKAGTRKKSFRDVIAVLCKIAFRHPAIPGQRRGRIIPSQMA